MNSEQVVKSIRTEKLQLSLWDSISHYWLAILLICISLPFLYFNMGCALRGDCGPIPTPILLFMTVPSTLGIAVLWLQSRRLRFVSVESELTRDELIAIVAETGREQNWTLHTKGDNFIVAKTHPSIFSGSWGEHVTALFEDGRVLINSICDPDKKSSVTSMGRNKRNEKALIERIKKANANKVYQ
ncbi:hypothetical protein [Pontibacter sp. BAB1700]|uniref:hypothetical protein n=1 Tax=Pontibacter sp. BAB1700 TaxID=1144253 RepID=UPI00026BCDC6|nr:hypothetical protein [Pontibacter sp. BAB1700]EJF10149.1 hypothetical protein O71_10964 [Pontibacter sp. BAB1700]